MPTVPPSSLRSPASTLWFSSARIRGQSHQPAPPDVLVKGADWKPGAIVGADTVRAHGGTVKTIRLTAGRSTFRRDPADPATQYCRLPRARRKVTVEKLLRIAFVSVCAAAAFVLILAG